MAISDSGYLYTVSNRAFDSMVIAYDLDGNIIADYKIEELFSTKDFERVKKYRTVSTYQWICSGFMPVFNGDTLLIKDAIGGLFIFEEKTGKFHYSNDNVSCERQL